MKKILRNRKKSGFPKFVKILMVILMAFGVMQIPGQSINTDNVVHAMDAEAKASFDGVTVKDGAKISLGDQFATYVGNKTLLSDKTSGWVAGDTTSIENGSNAVWNSYYSKDRANAMGVLSQNGLPNIAEINLWKSNIPSIGADYWLNDAKTVTVDDGSGLTTSTGKKYSFDTRAFAYKDNTMADAKRAVSLSGEYLNEADKDNNGAKFDGKSIEIGNHSNISNINLSTFNRKAGYYKDLFAKTNSKMNNDLYFAAPSYDQTKPTTPWNKPDFFLGYNEDYGTLTDERKLRYVDLYKTIKVGENNLPLFDISNRVTLYRKATYEDLEDLEKARFYLFDPIEEKFSIPVEGSVYPQGTVVVFFFLPSKTVRNTTFGKIQTVEKFLLEKDKQGTEKISGNTSVNVTKEVYEGSIHKRIYPAYEDFPLYYKDNIHVLYGQLPRELKVFNDYETFGSSVPTSSNFTEGLRYYETDKTIHGTTLKGATNTVRPKMTLDTSKIKFARQNSSSSIAANSTLGDMPTTELVKDGNYKLALNNDNLGVGDVAKGTNITATGGTAPKGSVTENNVITITPGTTEITIPVSIKGDDKISAISTKKDGTKAYGVVGSKYDKSVTINIADLMDTNKVTSKTGQSKTITLFEEKHNGANYSDEISTTGLDITVKVENPQTIDFTQTTKDLLRDNGFSEKETFEVNATVTKKGIESLVDTKTPITFTTDSSYLEQVGTTKWDDASLTATATFRVKQLQKTGISDDKFKITIKRSGTDSNDPAPSVVSDKVTTLMETYTITYDGQTIDKLNTSEPATESKIRYPSGLKGTYTIEDSFTISNYPSLTGNNFVGWTWEGQITPTKTVNIQKNTIGGLNFKSHFELKKYSVNYYNTDAGGYISSSSITHGEKIPVDMLPTIEDDFPHNDPIKGKYKFRGWFNKMDPSDSDLPFNVETEVVKNPVALYGIFEVNKYNVEFKVDADTPIVTMPDVEWGALVNAPTIKFGKEYYTFTDKWYKDPACTQEFNILKDPIKENTTLYAGWEKTPYTITYDKNHETATGSTDPTTIQVGDTDKVFGANQFIRNEYVFTGWNTEADGSGISYEVGDSIPTDAPKDMRLYAQWVQEASYFVAIPKSIQLQDSKKEESDPDADKALATEEIKVVVNGGSGLDSKLPDDDILVRTDVNFSLTLTSSTSDVSVYKTSKVGDIRTDIEYTDKAQPLVTLNAKDENKKNGYFTLKTPRADLKSVGVYRGKMNFYISYAPKSKNHRD